MDSRRSNGDLKLFHADCFLTQSLHRTNCKVSGAKLSRSKWASGSHGGIKFRPRQLGMPEMSYALKTCPHKLQQDA
jgi:hypothetical protein